MGTCQTRATSGASYIHQLIDEYIGPIPALVPRPTIFVGDVSPMNVTEYTRQFYITGEYMVIFMGTDEYDDLNSLELYLSVDLSVNR
jgi:hypothetical protein